MNNWRNILSWKVKKFEPGARVRINYGETASWRGYTGILIQINHYYDHDKRAPVWDVKLDEEEKFGRDYINQFYQADLDPI